MLIKTVGILSPGEMGYSIDLVLARHGLNVVTCLHGRSQLTRQRAELAGITNLPGLPDVAAASDLIISVVVPSAALEVSQSVAKATGFITIDPEDLNSLEKLRNLR